MASYSLLLSSSRFTSSIPISLKCSIPARRQHPVVVLKAEDNHGSSLLGLSGQLVLLKKNNNNNNNFGLACVSGGTAAESSEGDSSSSSSLCVILGRVWRNYVVYNRQEYQEKLRSIQDDNVPTEDKPILMTDAERVYCDRVIGIVNNMKSGVIMVMDSVIQLLRALVLPPIIYYLILNSVTKYLFGVSRIIHITLNSIFKALFGMEDGVGNLLDILMNVLFKCGTKSKWGKRLWPKPPKLKIGKKARPKAQEEVTDDVFEEEDNDDEAAAAAAA